MTDGGGESGRIEDIARDLVRGEEDEEEVRNCGKVQTKPVHDYPDPKPCDLEGTKVALVHIRIVRIDISIGD